MSPEVDGRVWMVGYFLLHPNTSLECVRCFVFPLAPVLAPSGSEKMSSTIESQSAELVSTPPHPIGQWRWWVVGSSINLLVSPIAFPVPCRGEIVLVCNKNRLEEYLFLLIFLALLVVPYAPTRTAVITTMARRNGMEGSIW